MNGCYNCGIIYYYVSFTKGTTMADKFLVIDGSSLIHRAFYGRGVRLLQHVAAPVGGCSAQMAGCGV